VSKNVVPLRHKMTFDMEKTGPLRMCCTFNDSQSLIRSRASGEPKEGEVLYVREDALSASLATLVATIKVLERKVDLLVQKPESNAVPWPDGDALGPVLPSISHKIEGIQADEESERGNRLFSDAMLATPLDGFRYPRNKWVSDEVLNTGGLTSKANADHKRKTLQQLFDWLKKEDGTYESRFYITCDTETPFPSHEVEDLFNVLGIDKRVVVPGDWYLVDIDGNYWYRSGPTDDAVRIPWEMFIGRTRETIALWTKGIGPPVSFNPRIQLDHPKRG
jgi:hypothetical protein